MHAYSQIENFIPRSAIPFPLCVLRRPERIAYGNLDVVLLSPLRLSAKFDV